MAISAGTLLLIWLFCLPAKMFGDMAYSTVVTARGGELLGARVADDGQWRFPPTDSLPEKFAMAVVEYEDHSFYSHCGISLRSIARAMWQNVTNGRIVSGASTITMQTIRLHRRGKRNIVEKIIEAFMATRLEARYSKEEILAMYASHAPFGGNVVGINAAVWRYLGNSGNEMSWAEAATLAVLQNAPSSVHLAKNRDKLLEKRNRLLLRLHKCGHLDEREYELAVGEPLIGQPLPMPQTAPHYVEHLHKTVHGILTKTAIDYPLQLRLDTLCSAWRNDLALSGVNDLAAVIVDVPSGEILAYCGNAGMETDRPAKWVDIARSPRSSGSILKPLLYCAAIEEGTVLANSLLPDIPTDFGGFVPKNFDGTCSGVIDAKSALALSLNIPNVWLLREFGVARFASLLHNCGLSTICGSPDRYGLSLILGGAEVTLKDIVTCYASLARFDGNSPLNDSTAIYQMLDAMRQVGRPDQLDWSRTPSAQNIAWKTGTSYGARDGWSIGVTPRFAVGVWVGNADGSGVADLTGARTAGPVMFDIFNLLPPCGWFAEPKAAREKVCCLSGHRAGKYCTQTRMENVSPKGHLTPICPYCKEIPTLTDAAGPSVMKPYFVLPPVMLHYYSQTHADYADVPVANAGLGESMRLISPANGAVIHLPKKPGNSRTELTCRATHSDPSVRLFWHLDNNYVGTTTDIHQVGVSPSPGVHKLTVYDNYGNSETIDIIIK